MLTDIRQTGKQKNEEKQRNRKVATVTKKEKNRQKAKKGK